MPQRSQVLRVIRDIARLWQKKMNREELHSFISVGHRTVKVACVKADDRYGDSQVRFTGFDHLNRRAYLMKIDIGTDWQWIGFDWLAIKRFTWDPVSPSSTANISIDDFAYEVPSPATLGMVLLGLLLIARSRVWGKD